MEELRFREVNLLAKATQLEIGMTSKPKEKGEKWRGLRLEWVVSREASI